MYRPLTSGQAHARCLTLLAQLILKLQPRSLMANSMGAAGNIRRKQ